MSLVFWKQFLRLLVSQPLFFEFLQDFELLENLQAYLADFLKNAYNIVTKS